VNGRPEERPLPPEPSQAEIDQAMGLIAAAEAEAAATEDREPTWEPGPKFQGPIGADAEGNVRTIDLPPRDEPDRHGEQGSARDDAMDDE
jgi:hypothetical protein